MNKRLYVNGITMTKLTSICKFMADLPLACRETKPTTALVICFGMGTTYRTLMSWNVDVTAVELVPSVRDSFAYFHSDADSVLSRANGRIVIDDGRRFLNRTKELYDVIVIDPPPPVQAAGSSLLYSTDFYRVLRQHLKPDGVLQTWYPDPNGPTLAAVARSLASHSRTCAASDPLKGGAIISLHRISLSKTRLSIRCLKECRLPRLPI